jgi:hypothetical protein
MYKKVLPKSLGRVALFLGAGSGFLLDLDQIRIKAKIQKL